MMTKGSTSLRLTMLAGLLLLEYSVLSQSFPVDLRSFFALFSSIVGAYVSGRRMNARACRIKSSIDKPQNIQLQ